jgi:hypothetical protein
MDGETIRAISELVCGNSDYGGNVPTTPGTAPTKSNVPRPYLQKWEVKEFLANCNFASREDLQQVYDQSVQLKESRQTFTKNCIERYCFPNGETRSLPPLFRELLLQLCAPRTYPANPEMAQLVIDYVNNTLSFYNVTVLLDGGRPKIDGSGTEVTVRAVGELPTNLKALVDADLEADLRDRWAEMQRCYEASAYRATLILLGGIAEAFLRVSAQRKPAPFKQSLIAKGKPGDPMTWDFSLLILAACQISVIDKARAQSLESIRMLRNLVHPFSEKGKQQSVAADQHSVLSAAAAVQGLLADCEKYVT